MSLKSEEDLIGMQQISQIVGLTLKRMQEYARPGMSTFELDQYGRQLLELEGARSAPKLTYGFPGWTCISLNEEVCHGIPSTKRILQGRRFSQYRCVSRTEWLLVRQWRLFCSGAGYSPAQ